MEFQGINDAGDVSGNYVDAAGIRHGFVLRRGEGVATVVDFPGAAWTRLWGINPQGDVVGTYGYGLTKVGIYDSVHSYVLDDETFIPFDVPDSTLTWAYDINPQGEIVGHYRDLAGVFHGFFRGKDGGFTTLDVPGATSTQARSINARGEIVGFYVSGGRNHGFIAPPVRER